MNSTHSPDSHPADLAPLSYGSGLALGLMLILGLPAEPRKSRPADDRPPAAGDHSFVKQALNARQGSREQWARLASSRP